MKSVEQLYKERPRSRFVRLSVVAMIALVVFAWSSDAFDFGELRTERAQRNLGRFLTEIRPYPLQDKEWDWGVAKQWFDDRTGGADRERQAAVVRPHGPLDPPTVAQARRHERVAPCDAHHEIVLPCGARARDPDHRPGERDDGGAGGRRAATVCKKRGGVRKAEPRPAPGAPPGGGWRLSRRRSGPGPRVPGG